MEKIFNNLMESAFGHNVCVFDRTKHYSTILVNLWGSEKKELYQNIENKLNFYAPRGSIRFAEGTQISEFGVKGMIQYILLVDAVCNWKDLYTYLKEHYSNVKISLFFLLPNQDATSVQKVRTLLIDMNIHENIYIFTQNEYNFTDLTDSICAAIILNIFFKNPKCQARQYRANTNIKAYIGDLEKSVQERIKRYPEICWSSFSGKITDPKRDFLYSYIYSLIEKASYNEEPIFRAFDELVNISLDEVCCGRTLENAIQLIPQVTSSVIFKEKDYEEIEKRDFYDMFGQNWKLVLDWTVYSSLKAYDSGYNEEFFIDSTCEIYSKNCIYFEKGIIKTRSIDEILEAYIEILKQRCDTFENAINNAGESEKAKEYLNRHIKLYNAKNIYSFWLKMQTTLRRRINAKDTKMLEIQNSVATNVNLLNSLLMYNSFSAIEEVNDYDFTIADILDACQGKDTLRRISEIYNTCEQSHALPIREESSNICSNVPIPGLFSRSVPMNTIGDTDLSLPYVISGNETHGIYLEIKEV